MNPAKDSIYWEDPVLKRWFDTIMRQGTKYGYRSAFRVYTQYTKLSPGQMIDEAVEDSKKDPRQRTDILLSRLLGFYNYLKTDYPKKTRGKGEHKITGKGVSDKLAHMMVGAVRSFYATYDLAVRMKGRRRMPRPKVENRRMIVGAEQVKILVDHARSPRDRAIILTNFQGGLDVSTLCSLRYGDVAEGLAKNEYPLKLNLHRQKTGTDFYTFLGKDAIEALKAYLADMKQRDVTFNHGTALFVQNKNKAAMKTANIQAMMREVALRSGFIDGENNGKDFNPLGPHALRESFGSIMTNSGVPDTIVDFWHGHEIGEMAEAYRSVQFESLKKMYLDREKLLSVSGSKVDLEEVKEKLRQEVEQQTRQLQTIINGLVSENIDLKKRIQSVEAKFASMEKTVGQIREAVGSLEQQE
jgi:integrase/recombinase XerD